MSDETIEDTKVAVEKTEEEIEEIALNEVLMKEAEENAKKLKEATDLEKAAAVKKEKEGAKEKVKVIFRRNSHSYETGPGDKKYKKDQKVTFESHSAYMRWYRRGACETPKDREVRLAREVVKKANDILVQQNG